MIQPCWKRDMIHQSRVTMCLAARSASAMKVVSEIQGSIAEEARSFTDREVLECSLAITIIGNAQYMPKKQ
jgi:hypothetical protein